MSTNIPYGPLMIDVEGLSLTEADKRRLQHPLVGGVILFSRNYKDPVQLSALTQEIADLRHPPLPITVDMKGAGCSASAKASRVCPP